MRNDGNFDDLTPNTVVIYVQRVYFYNESLLRVNRDVFQASLYFSVIIFNIEPISCVNCSGSFERKTTNSITFFKKIYR